MERQLFYRYQYDGSFSGFLCCVFESYSKKEIPCAFSSGEDMQMALYPQRIIETNREHALRVYRALRGKISPEAQNLVACGFLSCSPERDKVLYRFIRRGFETGGSIMRQFSHPDVEPLMNIARAAGNEAQLLRGFIRFSEVGGAFAAEIEPCFRFCGSTSVRGMPMKFLWFTTARTGRPCFTAPAIGQSFPWKNFRWRTRTKKKRNTADYGSGFMIPLQLKNAIIPHAGGAIYRSDTGIR